MHQNYFRLFITNSALKWTLLINRVGLALNSGLHVMLASSLPSASWRTLTTDSLLQWMSLQRLATGHVWPPSHLDFFPLCEANSIHFVLLFLRLRHSGGQTISAARERISESSFKSVVVMRRHFTASLVSLTVAAYLWQKCQS